MSRTSTKNARSKFARIAGAMAIGVAACVLTLGCERKPARLVVSEEILPGMNTDTAEYQKGSIRVVSRVTHSYNAPTGDRSEAGDFTEVFRAMTGKELAEPAAVRSVSGLLTTLERAGVKLTAEPGAKVEDSPIERRVRAYRVGH